MSVIKVSRKNHAFINVSADPDVMASMRSHFQFKVDGYQFTPKYKAGVWDGSINLINYRGDMYSGLFSKLQEFVNSSGNDHTIEQLDSSYYGYPHQKENVSADDVAEFLDGLNIHAKGEKISPYDYQQDAILTALQDKQRLLLSPTASGKSLIIYSLLRWIQRDTEGKLVVVVPTTSLVKQMIGDFKDYAEFSDWDVDENCHMIYSGQDKHTSKQIIVTTWQSLAKYPKTFFHDIAALIGDEAHGFKAKSLTGIMENCVNASYRIGTTGTLDNSKVNKLVLEGCFGPIHRVTKTKKLMEEGRVADLAIAVTKLVYPKDIRKVMSKSKYHDEIKFINEYDYRNNLIKDMSLNLDGNTIVMFKIISHGKEIFEKIKDASHKNRKVFFVSGEESADRREEIREIVEKEKDAIIVASLGVFSTGVNIRNIHNIIFAAPTKSSIKVLQSIGRGLRKSDDGRQTLLIDIVDDIHWRRYQNFALKHGAERIKIYASEGFKYTITSMDIEE